MTDQERINIAVARHERASHAMQSGVAVEQGRGSDDGSPKHLRVGINVALVDHAALVKLLIDKGLISEVEYAEVTADGMEREVARYEERISRATGSRVTLG